METSQNIDKICQQLLTNQTFLSKLSTKLSLPPKQTLYATDLDLIIEQISDILQQLIQKKLEHQMADLIADNNRILEEIKFSLERKSSKFIQGSSAIDTSFTEIHNIITEEKRKAFDGLNDADVEKSTSLLQRYEDTVQKIVQIQKRVRGLEDRYQTNFKSLWNVLSMTEAAVFDHIKQNKTKQFKKIQSKQPQKDSSFLSAFWK